MTPDEYNVRVAAIARVERALQTWSPEQIADLAVLLETAQLPPALVREAIDPDAVYFRLALVPMSYVFDRIERGLPEDVRCPRCEKLISGPRADAAGDRRDSADLCWCVDDKEE